MSKNTLVAWGARSIIQMPNSFTIPHSQEGEPQEAICGTVVDVGNEGSAISGSLIGRKVFFLYKDIIYVKVGEEYLTILKNQDIIAFI